MSDAPILTETQIKPAIPDLAKPVEAPSSTPSPETQAQAGGTPTTAAEARKALEEIAAGPEREKVNMLLTQGAQLLLDAADPRVAIAAVARSAAPTPLGTELRRDVLTSLIGEMKGDKFSAEGREALTKVQREIATINLPKTDPARSEFAKFLEAYSRDNPDKAVNPTLIEAIRTRKQEAGALMTQVLQTDTGLAASLWAEMKGDGTQPPPNVATPEGLLTAAGIEATPDNAAKVQKLYQPKGPNELVKVLADLKSNVPSFLITTGMLLMLVSQFVQSEGGGGGRH